jgi:DNA-binding FadR family transcriptional regulator
MNLAPVARRSVVDAAYDQLAGRIIEGELRPGDDLPPERRLTELLGVNRQAVREALQRLAQDGLVVIQHGGATRVNDFRQSGGLQLLPRLVVSDDGRFDRTVVRSVVEMRARLAPDIARLAAERGIPEHLDRLDPVAKILDASALNDVSLGLVNLELWDVLIDAADNIAYRFAFNSLKHCYAPFAAALAAPLHQELRDKAGRARLIAAVKRGDGAAAARAADKLLEPSTTALITLLAGL